jgi:hypothetical protein
MDREPAKTFEDLIVWQKAHSLVLEIYRISRGFPKDEIYGLTSQIRRSAASVPANIAEGFKKTRPRRESARIKHGRGFPRRNSIPPSSRARSGLYAAKRSSREGAGGGSHAGCVHNQHHEETHMSPRALVGQSEHRDSERAGVSRRARRPISFLLSPIS